MIVADASVILELLLQTPKANLVRQRVFTGEQEVFAPHVLDLEVAQVTRRYVLSKTIDAARGEEMLQDYLDLPVTRYIHTMLLHRIWQLRDNLSAYDAAYVALAEVIGATLVTADGHLASVPGLRVAVEVL